MSEEGINGAWRNGVLDMEIPMVFHDVNDDECMRAAVWRIFQALAIQ